ncbi:MAG TPA: hypothetical protein VGA99_02680 [bacterium]
MIQPVFFALFTNSAIGLIFVTLFIPLQQIGKLYFRVTTIVAFVLVGLVLLSKPFGAPTMPEISGFDASTTDKLAYFSLQACLIVIVIYNIALPRYHKTLLVSIFVSGMLGVIFYSLSLHGFATTAVYDQWLIVGNSLSSALLLGSVLGAMITGHWYLVQHKLSITPLKTSTWIYLLAVVVRGVIVLCTLLFGGEAVRATGLFAGLGFRSYLFIARIVIGLLIPFVFGLMTWNAAKIQSTQSATGILYATIVVVLLGEAFAGFLYLATGIPL